MDLQNDELNLHFTLMLTQVIATVTLPRCDVLYDTPTDQESSSSPRAVLYGSGDVVTIDFHRSLF